MATETITEKYDFDEVLQTERFTFPDGRVIQLDSPADYKDLLAARQQITSGPRSDRYRAVVDTHLRATRSEREVNDIARDVALCGHDVIHESPLYAHLTELLDTHPVTLRRRARRADRDEMIAQLYQSDTWTNARGRTIDLADIDVRYARNIMGLLQRNERRYMLAIVHAEGESLLRGWDGDHGRDLTEGWLQRTPLYTALDDKVTAASRAEHLVADAKQAARKVRHRITGEWG